VNLRVNLELLVLRRGRKTRAGAEKLAQAQKSSRKRRKIARWRRKTHAGAEKRARRTQRSTSQGY